MNPTNYWDNQPCNIKHSSLEPGSIDYFLQVRMKKYRVEPHIEQFAGFDDPLLYRAKVLELGCGIGTDMIEFIASGAQYWGIDSSVESLRLAQRRLFVYNMKGFLYKCDIEDIKSIFKGEQFDLIYSFGVLHHIPYIEKALEDIQTLCHKETVIKIMLYSKYSWKNLRIKLGLDQYEAQAGVPIANTYSFREIRRLMKDYEIVSLRKAHIFKYKLGPYKEHKYEVLWYWKWMPERLFNFFERHLGWHTLIEARLKQ